MRGEKEQLGLDGGKLQRLHTPRTSLYKVSALRLASAGREGLDGAASSARDTVPHVAT